MSDSSCSATSTPSHDDAEEDRGRQPLSQLIDQLAVQRSQGSLTITDVVAWFQERATLALMMIFGNLNILPNPSGSSVILGLPMLYLSLAMLLDRPSWLPRIVMERGISAAMVSAIAARASPALRRCERLLRPRLPGLFQARLGLLAFRPSVSASVRRPDPARALGNILPAPCMTALALALAMRDG